MFTFIQSFLSGKFSVLLNQITLIGILVSASNYARVLGKGFFVYHGDWRTLQFVLELSRGALSIWTL